MLHINAKAITDAIAASLAIHEATAIELRRPRKIDCGASSFFIHDLVITCGAGAKPDQVVLKLFSDTETLDVTTHGTDVPAHLPLAAE